MIIPPLKYPEPIAPKLHKLYPKLNDEELRAAQDRLRRYAKCLITISERLAKEGKPLPNLNQSGVKEKP